MRRNLVIRTGRFGRFISCSGFPECRYRRSVVNKTGALCPVCQGDLVERKTKQKKRIFYGCNNYPTCNFAIWEKPVPELCPDCGGLMIVPRSGQNPVCYQEFVAQQGVDGEKPRLNCTYYTKKARKKTAASEDVSLFHYSSFEWKINHKSQDHEPRTTRARTKKTTTTSRNQKCYQGKSLRQELQERKELPQKAPTS